MMKQLAFLNIMATGAAFALFVWANTKPEVIVVETYDGHHYHLIRNGPGWPFSAWDVDQMGFHVAPLSADDVLVDPFPEDHLQARLQSWLFNGPIGLLLLGALYMNVRVYLLFRRHKRLIHDIGSQEDNQA
jgi:hypothetical protein